MNVVAQRRTSLPCGGFIIFLSKGRSRGFISYRRANILAHNPIFCSSVYCLTQEYWADPQIIDVLFCFLPQSKLGLKCESKLCCYCFFSSSISYLKLIYRPERMCSYLFEHIFALKNKLASLWYITSISYGFIIEEFHQWEGFMCRKGSVCNFLLAQ